MPNIFKAKSGLSTQRNLPPRARLNQYDEPKDKIVLFLANYLEWFHGSGDQLVAFFVFELQKVNASLLG